VLAKDGPIAPGVRRSFDFAGAATLTAAMLLLVRTIVEAPDTGWGAPETLGGLALAAALLGAFVGIERRSAQPLVRLGILRSAPLLRANIGMMTMFGAYIGFQFVGTLYLQSVLGWSPLETALAFLPGGLLVAFGSPRLGPLVDRFGTARIIVVGSLAFLVGYALFNRIGDSFSYVGLFLPTMLLIGVGFGLSFPAFNMQATAGIADHEQGLASGLVNTSLQVGGAIGLAISTAVISANSGGATQGAALMDGFQPAIAVVTGIAAIGLVVALTGTRLLRGREPELAIEREAA
jgi:predicted MFS family arabinose efflux permease